MEKKGLGVVKKKVSFRQGSSEALTTRMRVGVPWSATVLETQGRRTTTSISLDLPYLTTDPARTELLENGRLVVL